MYRFAENVIFPSHQEKYDRLMIYQNKIILIKIQITYIGQHLILHCFLIHLTNCDKITTPTNQRSNKMALFPTPSRQNG